MTSRKLAARWSGSCSGMDCRGIFILSEGFIPGISLGVRLAGDVVEPDGSHAPKAGPCVVFDGVQGFIDRRRKLDGCLTGARLAKDRAGQSLTQVAIPDKLDYPR